MKSLSQHLTESFNINESKENINEDEDIKSDKDFMEYGRKVLKEQHGEDYDADKAEETLKGILDKADGDYGKAIGMLTAKE